METKRFQKNDSGFVCQNCGRQVSALGYTSRNHCPHCLYSLHVDVLPGDRANECRGLMKPIKTEPDAKKGFVIIHECTKCGARVRNRAAYDSKGECDDIELLIALTAGQQK